VGPRDVAARDAGLDVDAPVRTVAPGAGACTDDGGPMSTTATTALGSSTLVVPGLRSELRLEHGRIVLVKEATTQPEPTEVAFGVDRIRGVTLQRPARGGRGWLHVRLVGGSPPPPTELAASSDPYTLPLTSRGVGRARRLERLVDEHVRSRGLPSEDATATVATSTGVAVVDAAGVTPTAPARTSRHLALLDELYDAGVLTEQERARAVLRVTDL
jgi:hypothetical protein